MRFAALKLDNGESMEPNGLKFTMYKSKGLGQI